MKQLTDFSGHWLVAELKAVFIALIFVIGLMVIADIIGIESGRGGSPYGEAPYYNE